MLTVARVFEKTMTEPDNGKALVEVNAQAWAAMNQAVEHGTIVDVVTAYEGNLAALGQCVDVFRQMGESAIWGMVEVFGRIGTRYGEDTLRSFASEHGIPVHTAYRYRKIYKAFPDQAARWEHLSVSHHALAASTETPGEWMDKAAANHWSVREMWAQINATALPESTATPLPDDEAEKDADAILETFDKVDLIGAESLIRGIVKKLKDKGELTRHVVSRLKRVIDEEAKA